MVVRKHTRCEFKSLNLLRMILWPQIWSVLVHLENKCAFYCFQAECYEMSVRSSWLIMLFKSSMFLLMFFLLFYQLLRKKCWSLQLKWNLPFSFQFHLFLPHVFWSFVNCSNVLSSWWIDSLSLWNFPLCLKYYSLFCCLYCLILILLLHLLFS